jgi:hypothetical protein
VLQPLSELHATDYDKIQAACNYTTVTVHSSFIGQWWAQRLINVPWYSGTTCRLRTQPHWRSVSTAERTEPHPKLTMSFASIYRVIMQITHRVSRNGSRFEEVQSLVALWTKHLLANWTLLKRLKQLSEEP